MAAFKDFTAEDAKGGGAPKAAPKKEESKQATPEAKPAPQQEAPKQQPQPRPSKPSGELRGPTPVSHDAGAGLSTGACWQPQLMFVEVSVHLRFNALSKWPALIVLSLELHAPAFLVWKVLSRLCMLYVHAHAGGRVVASPYARKLAHEAGVDVSQAQASGPGGRIVAADVQKLISSGGGKAEQPSAGAPSQVCCTACGCDELAEVISMACYLTVRLSEAVKG